LSRKEKFEQHIRKKTHKPNALRFWVEGGVILLYVWPILILVRSPRFCPLGLPHRNHFVEVQILIRIFEIDKPIFLKIWNFLKEKYKISKLKKNISNTSTNKFSTKELYNPDFPSLIEIRRSKVKPCRALKIKKIFLFVFTLIFVSFLER